MSLCPAENHKRRHQSRLCAYQKTLSHQGFIVITMSFLCRVGLLVLFSTSFVCGKRSFPPRNPGGRSFASSTVRKDPPFTIANMTCDFFTQPLNHFDLPRNKSGYFRQRFCYYNDFVDYDDGVSKAPVFLYTGNESPLEEYINHTGLIWESAPQFGAQVVFIEHRYEGHSLPDADMPHCLAYDASYQALADYANFIETYLFRSNHEKTTPPAIQPNHRRPVIVFGGSYGGMLSAWMRMLYPHLVAGAIAGSAPIGGFPTNRPRSIDAASSVIRHGLDQPWPPTKKVDETDDNEATINHCPDNLLAAWPLIDVLSREETGRKLLQETFQLCQMPPEDPSILTSWAQSPWFDMAEGSFPYPSSYITFALTHRLVELPAWPLQAACWNASALHKDWRVSFTGNQSDVLYNITFGDSGLVIEVDWDQATPRTPCDDDNHQDKEESSCWGSIVEGSESVRGLLESVRDAVSVWFNVTRDVTCYNLTRAPNQQSATGFDNYKSRAVDEENASARVDRSLRTSQHRTAAEQCAHRMSQGSWPWLCCNEEMNLIICDASGLGNDAFWPPSHPRGTESYSDIYPAWDSINEACLDPDGIFGFPQTLADPWATWMDVRYGGLHVSSHSNIVFSNGLLDPWSAAGVYAKGGDPADRPNPNDDNNNNPNWQPYHGIPGLYVQQIQRDGGDDRMIALIMDVGGHHTDLMYSDPVDPPCIQAARRVERGYIRKWIQEFWRQEEVLLGF